LRKSKLFSFKKIFKRFFSSFLVNNIFVKLKNLFFISFSHSFKANSINNFFYYFLAQQLFIPNLNINQRWKQHGITIAGGHGDGNQLNQLSYPCGVYIDDDQTIYVADSANHRLVEWKSDVNNGQIVAGENGRGDRNDQLDHPTMVIVDKENYSLIICDQDNRRVVRWPRRNGQSGEILISNIDCWNLIMDNDGYLYVSDIEKHEVRRWKIGETEGTIVAGGNGQGDLLNKLDCVKHIFIDKYHSVYVSDRDNHRVMKWVKGAREGIVVAGGVMS
jgi:DNA-binding beta-propeller fold protein YncE